MFKGILITKDEAGYRAALQDILHEENKSAARRSSTRAADAAEEEAS